MILLDTDHISVLQRPSAACDRLLQKLDASSDSPATSVITLEEQSRSWIAEIGRRRIIRVVLPAPQLAWPRGGCAEFGPRRWRSETALGMLPFAFRKQATGFPPPRHRFRVQVDNVRDAPKAFAGSREIG